MGNCQAIDAATLVVQHPNGKVDKFYWAVSASEIMKMNPGHYVALLISTTLCQTNDKENCPVKNDNNNNQVRLTRIKLLRPTDTLVLGQVYRLITTQEVMKGLWAKKQAKMRKNHSESTENPGSQADTAARRSEQENDKQETKHDRHRPRTTTSSTNSATARSRTWQPSLKSISEAAS
ncbi:serine/threonine-protein kinase pakF-like [Fagus crenata]